MGPSRAIEETGRALGVMKLTIMFTKIKRFVIKINKYDDVVLHRVGRTDTTEEVRYRRKTLAKHLKFPQVSSLKW